MQEKTDIKERAFQELVRVLEEAVKGKADSIELEYEGQDLVVFYQFGNFGFGETPIPRELQQAVIGEIVDRAHLARKCKGKMRVTLLENEYDVTVEEYDSFGDSAFTLKLKKKKGNT